MKELVAVVVDYFIEDHGLYLGAGWQDKYSSLGLNELSDFCFVPVPIVGLVFIDVGFALGMGGGFGFRNFLCEFDFRRSTGEHRGVSASRYSSLHVPQRCLAH